MSLSARLSIPAIFFVLASCSPTPTPTVKKEPPKPPEPVSARHAFHRMYATARTWAQDIEAMQMQSITLDEVAPKSGKYPAWRATYVSQSRRASKSYTFSVITVQGLNEGIYGGPEESYTGPRGQNSPFPVQALKIDSDEAYANAMKHGVEYSKKNPDKPIILFLEHIKRFPNPVWRVVWGESISASNFSIYIDASTGDYLQTMR